MEPEIHISSIVVHARPEMVEAVKARILRLDCEIAPTDGDTSRLVVIVERPRERQIADVLDAINLIPGVFSALLVYHHAEPAASLAELMP